jgi:hypothetical protein
LIPLYGEEYVSIIRVAHKHILSAALLGIIEENSDPLQTRLANPIVIGDSYDDIRVPGGFILPSGSGKQTIINAIEKSSKNSNPSYPEVRYSPVTSWLPAQMVGTGLWADEKRKKEVTLVPGVMNDHYVVLDEPERSLTGNDTDSRDLRSYIKKGLNPFGSNLVHKPLTEFNYSQRLKYFPRFCPAFFMRPIRIPLELCTDGFIRRLVMAYLKVTFDQKLKGFDQSFKKSERDLEQDWSLWQEHLGFLRSQAPNIRWNIGDDMCAFIKDSVNRIAKETVKRSPELDEFTSIMLHPLKWRLAKFACIDAADRKWWRVIHAMPVNDAPIYIEVKAAESQSALADFKESWATTIAVVKDLVRGGPFKPKETVAVSALHVFDVQKSDTEQVIFKVLREKGAFSEETGLRVGLLLKEVHERTGVPEATVRTHYLKLKKDARISVEKLGQETVAFRMDGEMVGKPSNLTQSGLALEPGYSFDS